MAITTLDGLVAAARQRVNLYKTASRTTVAGGWFTNFDVAGDPGAGTLAIGNTANGVVPTDATAGYPIINAFGGGARGYLARAAFKNSVVGQIRVFDRIFAAGAYAFNANTALTSQPSFASRVSLNGGSPIYEGLELWAEMVTAATGNHAVTIQYTNEAGTPTRSTGAIGIGAAPSVGRCWQLPLQAGDKGVQLISNVQGTVSSAGTFNVMVLRPLIDIYIGVASAVVVQNWADLNLPEIFADSALYMLLNSPSGTALGTMDIGNIDVVNG
jgi:hypothetical protein